jgi:hypothetical protein
MPIHQAAVLPGSVSGSVIVVLARAAGPVNGDRRAVPDMLIAHRNPGPRLKASNPSLTSCHSISAVGRVRRSLSTCW